MATASSYPLDPATVISAANPTTSYGVVAPTGGSSPGNLDVQASTAPTAVPIAQQQQTAVYNQLPGYGTSMSNVGSNIASETAGQLPQDVVNQITQTAAERGITTGMAGSGSSNANLEQALGLNSLALTNTGQKNLEGILPTLPGNTVANSPSMYATPSLYEGANVAALGLSNQNSNSNAALSIAQQVQAAAANAAKRQTYYPTITGGGGTSGTGATGMGGSTSAGGAKTGGTGGTSGTTGTTGTTGSSDYQWQGPGANTPGAPAGTTGTGGTMADIPTNNMQGGSPTGVGPGQTYMGADPNAAVHLDENGQPVDQNGNPIADPSLNPDPNATPGQAANPADPNAKNWFSSPTGYGSSFYGTQEEYDAYYGTGAGSDLP